MPGRPQQIDPDVALEKAMLLFWEKGYESTSLADLESGLEVGRQSIYNTFGDKKALFLKAYKHYLDTRLSEALQLLEEGVTPQDKLRNLFYHSLDCNADKHFGCFIGNTVAAPVGQAAEIEELSSKAIKVFVRHLEDVVEPLFGSSEKVTDVAWNFFIIFQGTQLMAKQQSSRSQLLRAIDQNIDQLPSPVDAV